MLTANPVTDRDLARAIGARIRAARDKAGLTQTALAELLPPQQDATMVSKWEAGVRMPTAPNLIELATALGVSADYLLGLDASTERPSRA